MPIETIEEMAKQLCRLAKENGFTGCCCALYNDKSLEIVAWADPESVASMAKTDILTEKVNDIAARVFGLGSPKHEGSVPDY
jgi:hypothetical protein